MKSNKLSGGRLSSLFSTVLSNPLYFSYLLFFSPYLLAILAFLSPLFATTALLAGVSAGVLQGLNPAMGFDGVGGGRDEDGGELKWVEEFDVFGVVFGNAGEYPGGEFSDHGSFSGDSEMNAAEFSGEKTEEKVLRVLVSDDGDFSREKTREKVLGVLISDSGNFPAKFDEFNREKAEEKVLGVLVSDSGNFPAKFEEFAGEKTEEKVSNDGDFPAKFDDFSGEKTQKKVLGVLFSDSGNFLAKCDEKTEEKVLGALFSDDGDFPAKYDEFTGERSGNEKQLQPKPSSVNGGNQSPQKPLIKADSRKRGEAQWRSNNGGNPTKTHHDYSKPSITPSSSDLGRREKEWRRTLACMLFEERHNSGAGAGGGEGMDKLWEDYEKTEHDNGGMVEDDDEEEEGEEGGNVEVCCLQALKMSAGKMNFGKVLKISRAFKGIGGGWLGRRRHQVHHHHHGGDSKKGSRY